jgi:phage tail tape-measure protein
MKIITFAAGVAVGFIIGSRAGRGAYEVMRRKWRGFAESDTVHHVNGDVKDFAGRAASDVGDKVSETVSKVTEKATSKIDEVTGKSGNGSSSTSPAV